MKWIDSKTHDGEVIGLAVNADGDMFMRRHGQESAIGKPGAYAARMGDKRRYAEIDLAPIGVVRTLDVNVIDAWFSHLDLSGERSKKRVSAGMIGWGMLGGIVLSVVLAFWLGVPWLARIAAENMPVEWEKSMASGTLASLESDGFKASEVSSEEQARYRKLFEKVAAGTQYGNPITLEFRSWTDPNAFAIPGGTVVVTDQMLKLMSTDDEFTAVMAHEVGHLEKRHGIRSVLQQGGAWLVVSLLVGDSSGLAAVATALPSVLIESAYSRDFEREADVYAFARLNAMNISPKAFASLMRKMKAQADAGEPGALKYFSSHPPTDERIEAAEAAAK
jgi:Zn-dependent protease with chaperone function